jgi:hypothetical protein
VRAPEQLPLASVDQFAKMKDGQANFTVRPGGAQVINLAASRPEPVSLKQATPAIEQFLLNERKRKLIADDRAGPAQQPPARVHGRFREGCAAQRPSLPARTAAEDDTNANTGQPGHGDAAGRRDDRIKPCVRAEDLDGRQWYGVEEVRVSILRAAPS